MSIRFAQISASVIAIGLIAAAVCAILYFMRLPIFDAEGLAWAFVLGLVSAAAATLGIALRSIWEQPDYIPPPMD